MSEPSAAWFNKPWAEKTQAERIAMNAHLYAVGFLRRYNVRIPPLFSSLRDKRAWANFGRRRFGPQASWKPRSRWGPVEARDSALSRRFKTHKGRIRRAGLGSIPTLRLRSLNAVHRALGIEEVKP